MSPFIILIFAGAGKVEPSRWFELPTENMDSIRGVTDDDPGGGFFPNAVMGGVLWRPLLNNLFWNLNSFDAAGSFAGEIENSAVLFPRAMLLGVIFVAAGYFFPLLIAIGASDSEREDWVDGYLARVTGEVVGPWLGAWTVFAAGISNIALFQAELSADAFQLMGMADRGHLPKIFSKRSRHGTPTNGIMLGTAVIVVMGVSDFESLIEMLNFNYALSLLMEYAAFIKLRISRPDVERPYKIPLGTIGCTILFTPPIMLTVLVLGLATYATYAFVLVVNIVGLLVIWAKKRSDVEPDDEGKPDGSIKALSLPSPVVEMSR
jgi:amino acid transporter